MDSAAVTEGEEEGEEDLATVEDAAEAVVALVLEVGEVDPPAGVALDEAGEEEPVVVEPVRRYEIQLEETLTDPEPISPQLVVVVEVLRVGRT